MGLDGVELVMELEDAFDLSIPDADAERITTVGGLYVYVCTRVVGRSDLSTRCVSRDTFIRARRELTQLSTFDVGRFRPRARLATCVSLTELDAAHDALATALQLKLPRQTGYLWRRFVDRSVFGGRATVRDWITAIHRLNGLPMHGPWSEVGVWRKIQQIVSEQFNVPAATVTPDKHLVYDFGV